MNNDVLEKYKINFDDMIPKILDSYVKVYGEKNRNIIEEKIKQVYLITYITKEQLNSYNTQRLTEKENELTLMLLGQIGEELTDEEKEEFKEDGIDSLSYYNTIIVSIASDIIKEDNAHISGFCKEISENKYESELDISIITNRCKILNNLGLKITPDNYNEIIKLDESKKILNKVDLLYKSTINCNEELNKYKNEIKDDLDYIDDCDKLEERIKYEKTVEFYKEILPYLNETERKKITDVINLSNNTCLDDFKKEVDKDNVYLDNLSILGTGLIESFSNESEELMNSSNEYTDYDKYIIKKKRIEYFKSIDLDLGDEYKKYEQDENALNLVPNTEFVGKIKDMRLKYIDEISNETFENTGTYKQNLDGLVKQNLLLPYYFDKDFVNEGVICNVANLFYNKDNNVEMKNIVYIPILDLLDGYGDVTLIHEIGHAIEASFQMEDLKNVIIKTGLEKNNYELLDINRGTDNNSEKIVINDPAKNMYRLFDETIHQKISMEVTEDLHEKGIYLIDNPDNAKIKGSTEYEHYNIILDDFYNNFKSDVIDAVLLDEKLDSLTEKVGKENLDRLNYSVNEYSQLPYNNLMYFNDHKMNNNLTQKADEIINRSKEAFYDIKEYTKGKESSFEINLKENLTDIHRVVERDLQFINNSRVPKDNINVRKDGR